MKMLVVVDICISTLAILPLAVSCWRGAWETVNYFSSSFPPWHCLGVTFAFQFAFLYLREPLVQTKYSSLTYTLLSRLYIYAFGLTNIVFWRSVWHISDNQFTSTTTVILWLVSLMLMVQQRIVPTLVGCPFILFKDHHKEKVFDFPTRFRANSADNVWLYVLDCGFSVCIVGTLVVFVWRGSWCLLDMFLFKGEILKSAWASLAIGYGLVFITFALQPPMKYLAKTLEGLSRLAVVDTYLLFSFCGTINVWRGVWNLLNLYAFPDNPLFSYSLTHAVGFIVLVLINSANSILVRGVYIDAEEPGEQCVDFPCYYLRLFFQAKRKKKLIRAAQKKQAEVLSGGRSEVDTLLVDAGSRRKRPSIVTINHHQGNADNV